MSPLDKIVRRVKWRIAHPQEGDSIGPLFGPPLPLEAIEEAETKLGYKLPPLLKRLYMEVGDGGFGPELSMLNGILSSFEEQHSPEWRERWRNWPTSLAEVAYFGCESYAFVDLSSPDFNMFYFDGFIEEYLEDIEVEDEANAYVKCGFTAYNLTFDEWVDRWARGHDVYTPEELESASESWDVGLARADKPNDKLLKHVPTAIGSRKQVAEKILEVVPYAQFHKTRPAFTHGFISGPDFTIKIDFGTVTPVESILLEVEGSESAIGIVTDIIRHLDVDAFEVCGGKPIKPQQALLMYRKHLKKNRQ